MMTNNKILTVSYGTFSCTLEGFDDSFDTMKAIAEYFRDLAADDRYFGAEPPQPDAEMMGRIAEREVARRVEVREHEGHIMLKAHEDAAADAPMAASISSPPMAAAAVAARTHQDAQVAEIEEADEDPQEVAVEVNLEGTPADVIAEDVEAEAEVESEETPEPMMDAVEPEMEEEPVVAEEESIEVAEETAMVEDDANPEPEENVEEVAETLESQDESSVEAENIADVEETSELETENVSVDVAEDDDAPNVLETEELVPTDTLHEETDTAEVEDLADTNEGEVEPELTAAEEEQDSEALVATEADNEIDQDNIASFFAESPIAAAVEEDIEEYDEPESFSDADDILTAEPVDPASATPKAESIADKLERIRAVVSQQGEHDDDGESTQTEEKAAAPFSLSGFEDKTADVENEDTNTLAAVAQDIEEAFDADDEIAAQAENQDAEELEADDLDSILDRIESGETSMDEEDDDMLDMSAEELFDTVAAAHEDLGETEENIFDALPEPVENEAQNAIGRVVKVNRADLEAALDTGELQDLDHADTDTEPTLSDEEESELQSELDTAKSEETDEDGKSHAGRDNLSKLEGSDDADLSRLMAEADHQMEEPEGATRRSAFAHLRAAVAARFADKSLDKDTSGEEEAQPYRSDLAEVVKPRRPEASAKGTTDARPSPLKLVAEQRIDSDTAQHDGPVAPRRVAAAEEELETAESSGFADFAHEMGATKLPQALEAAAAYLTFVEGQKQFSRPQLMSRVRQAECGSFSREDGLRSFGQLLRTGKIEKIKGGRFTASEAIGFKPDQRAAG